MSGETKGDDALTRIGASAIRIRDAVYAINLLLTSAQWDDEADRARNAGEWVSERLLEELCELDSGIELLHRAGRKA